jgi:hypothetical protein
MRDGTIRQTLLWRCTYPELIERVENGRDESSNLGIWTAESFKVKLGKLVGPSRESPIKSSNQRSDILYSLRHCKSATTSNRYVQSNDDPLAKSASNPVWIKKWNRAGYRRGSLPLIKNSIEMDQHLTVSCRILPNSSGNLGVNQSQTSLLLLPDHSSAPRMRPQMNSHMARVLCRSYTFVESISARYPSTMGLIRSKITGPKSCEEAMTASMLPADGCDRVSSCAQ